MRTEHRQVLVWNPHFEEDTPIDEEIADLMDLLWNKLNYVTFNSCQNNSHGSIWIEFRYLQHVEDFLDILTTHRDYYLDLYNSIFEEWRFKANPHDFAEKIDFEKDEAYLEGPSQMFLPMSVRFPREDLPEVMEILLMFVDFLENMQEPIS